MPILLSQGAKAAKGGVMRKQRKSAGPRGVRRFSSGLMYKRPLRFEPLEDRRLLSITVDTLVDENDGVGVGTDLAGGEVGQQQSPLLASELAAGL
jgi:hypothetical protein